MSFLLHFAWAVKVIHSALFKQEEATLWREAIKFSLSLMIVYTPCPQASVDLDSSLKHPAPPSKKCC